MEKVKTKLAGNFNNFKHLPQGNLKKYDWGTLNGIFKYSENVRNAILGRGLCLVSYLCVGYVQSRGF